MSFKSYNGLLRRLGRSVVLPAGPIRETAERELFSQRTIAVCVDFGAGTRFWSDWLKTKCGRVFAVDLIYDGEEERNGVVCVKTLEEAEDKFTSDCPKGGDSLFWASDVFHHLNPELLDSLLEHAASTYDCVVIKDINCRRKFGNFMNALHDRVINHEKVIRVDPVLIADHLKSRGFTVRFREIPRLWYPHFLIIAEKAGPTR